MDNIDLFIHHSDFDERMEDFHQKLKKHLMDEYLYLSEKKDNLEAEAIQIRMEMDQKDKALFPNMEKGDVRKYFSPLSISGIKEKQKDEKEKLMNTNYNRIQDEMALLENRMKEIMDFLRDVDKLLEKDRESGESEFETSLEEADTVEYDSEFESEYESESYEEGEEKEKTNIDKDEYEDQKENYIQKYQYDYFQKYQVYPQMIRNLYNISDYCRLTDNLPEILIEFNDHNIELDIDVNESLIRQILYNIECAANENEQAAMILIEGYVEESSILISLSYVSEKKGLDTVKISYEISRAAK